MAGRPRIYHTVEEKAQAKKRTARAWYDRNKKTVNKEKRKERKRAGATPRARRLARKRTVANCGEPEEEPKEGTPAGQNKDTLALSIRQIEGVPKRFRKALVGYSPSGYLEMVCRRAIESQKGSESAQCDTAVEAIKALSLPFSKLKLAVEKYQGFILELGPHSSEYEKSKKMWTDMHLMDCHFQDIESRAMVRELEEDFVAGLLDFQKGYEVIAL